MTQHRCEDFLVGTFRLIMYRFILAVSILLLNSLVVVNTFQILPKQGLVCNIQQHIRFDGSPYAATADDNTNIIVDAEIVSDDGEFSSIVLPTTATDEEKKVAIGNLVADDEWAGVTMELADLVKKAVYEDLKAKGREFLGKDEYKFGDLSKEVDVRVKQGVADIRGKPEYEVGDLVFTLDEMSKNMTEKLTGKPYEVGDLSIEIDRRIKGAVAKYVGKDQYEPGDLTKAVTEKVAARVDDLFVNYEFGDISREVNRRRKEWVKDFLGEEAAANYKFGDISKKLASKFTGKDEYQFGDVSKKIIGNLFGNKKKE